MRMESAHLEIQLTTSSDNILSSHVSLEKIELTLDAIKYWSNYINPKRISIHYNQFLSIQNLKEIISSLMHHWYSSEFRLILSSNRMPDSFLLPELLEESGCILEIRTDGKSHSTSSTKHIIKRWQRTYYFNVIYTEVSQFQQNLHCLSKHSKTKTLIDDNMKAKVSSEIQPDLIMRDGKVLYSSDAIARDSLQPVERQKRNLNRKIRNYIPQEIKPQHSKHVNGFDSKKIILGFCIPSLSMGGVTRSLINMMNSNCDHNFCWSGVAIGSGFLFDPYTAKQILKHCPIYSSIDHPEFRGLVSVVGNACQMVLDRSDVINLWGYTSPTTELAITNWKKKPMLVTAHGQNEWTQKNIETSLGYANESILTSVSQKGVEVFPSHLQDHVKVIYNGVDFERCKPTVTRSEIRRRWGVSPETITLGYVGRFAPGKNIFAAAEAVSLLGESYHAIYVGEGLDNDNVISRVKDICGERCTIISRTEDIGSVFEGLDCLISASPSEGGPIVVSEAWVAGCPVVSTRVGFIPELESKYGQLVFHVPDNPTPCQIAQTVMEATRASPIVERAWNISRKVFDVKHMLKEYESHIVKKLKEYKNQKLKSNSFPNVSHVPLDSKRTSIVKSKQLSDQFLRNYKNSSKATEVDGSREDYICKSSIKVGFILYDLAFGGISRQLLNLMEAPIMPHMEWAGIAISTFKNYDHDVGKRIKRFCNIYSIDEFSNPFQEVINHSDVIYLTGYTQPHDLFDLTDFQDKTIITVAHGSCINSENQIRTALKYGKKHVHLAVSQETVNAYPEELHDTVHVIYNGVNISRCAPTIDRAKIRQAWGISETVTAIGYMGRMANDKNVLATAQAVKQLGEGYHAVYIGNGYAEVSLRSEIHKLCGPRCTILDKTEDIGSMLAALDRLIIASPAEGGPMVAAEAWLAGCPVISTPVGMIPELEKKHGTLTHRINLNPTPDELANAVKRSGFKSAEVQRAKSVAWRTFSPSKMLLEFENAVHFELAKTRVGFCISTCSMGGVSRAIITLLNQSSNKIRWSGIAIQGPGTFDPETAREVLNHCPIYCSVDDPRFQGLVTIVPNAHQAVVNRSDVVNLWGSIATNPELDQTDWNRVVVISSAHGECEWTRKNIDVSLKYGKQHLLHAVSEGGKNCFPEWMRNSVNVIYNGLDFNRCIAKRDRSQLRSEWGIKDGVKIVGYIGRFENGKNPLAVVNAVREMGDDYHALLVGEGVHEQQVIEQAKQICGNKVTIIPRTEDIGSILGVLDCLVVVSPKEGGPQVTMEAFGAKCPVVSTRVGFLQDFEPEYGKLAIEVPFEPSLDQLAQAIKQADRNHQRVEMAYQVAVQKFDPSEYISSFESMILNGTIITV
ncbi:Putative teichuronic acid biosynthesis glycosyltransferase TuaC [Gimesia alba]|uniref:Teichuronic acid biosynthesis glycosyltransferase TuaC n=1 Tax=Gimesia alba TaxID=2527973 RepID=A0A517R932_9PLAN|nr:glycosyltransferase family 4 protein [Gimesia alba]QDT40368.1 Putative teichuronic acid biosynthesis glycosyltransferase TuaC [Gimesia alba]